jgi:multiple sugar transport system substrate-binding protein
MKKRIFFIAVALVLVLVFVLPGCKTTGTTTETTAAATTAAGTTAAETTAAATTAAAGGDWGNIDWKQFAGTTLNVIATEMPVSQVYKAKLSEFEELTGIKINFQLFEDSDRRKKQIVDFSSGTGEFDVGNIGHSNREEFASYLEPLDKYLSDPKLTDKTWYNFEDYPKDVIAAGYSKAGPLVYIPYTAEYYLIAYLKDVFSQLGLKAPQTWDEYVQVTKALDDARKAGKITSYAYIDRVLPGASESGWSYTCSASRYGLTLVNFDTMTSYVNTPKGIEFMEWYTSWAKNYGPPGSSNWTWPDIAQAFGQGQLAMCIIGNASYVTIEDPTKSTVAGKIGYAHPLMKDGGKDPLWEWGWGMNASSKNKEAAWLFIEWLTSPTLMDEIGPEYGCPARISTYESAEYIKAMPSQEFIDAQVWMMKEGIDAHPQVISAKWAEALDIVSKDMNNVVAGIKDAKTACADAEAALEKIGYKAAAE